MPYLKIYLRQNLLWGLNMKSIRVLLVALSVIIAFSFSACSSKFQNNNSNVSEDDYVASVSGEKITVPEFKFMLNYVKAGFEQNVGVNPMDAEAVKAFWQNADNAESITKAKEESLDRLKELKIVMIKAREKDLKLDEEELSEAKSYIDQFVETEGEGNRDNADVKCKEMFGVTLAQLESIYEEYYLAGKYATEETKAIPFSDQELQAFYGENSALYDKVTVKHILILSQDATGQPLAEEEKANKKKLSEEILDKAKNGEDFEELVKEYSEDSGSKDIGGEYTFGKYEMMPEFEDRSINAKEGDMGFVETAYGFHVMKFIGKSGFENAKDAIMVDFQTDKYMKSVEQWKADKQYDLEINQSVLDAVSMI